MKSNLSFVLALAFVLLVADHARSQQTMTDTLLGRIVNRFKTNAGYKVENIINYTNKRADGLPDDHDIPCISGKEMLVVAVFEDKPKNLFARMLVTKKYNKKTACDEHPFQPVTFEEGLQVYYALLQVSFPAEANKLNCGVNLQVFDKANPAAKIWLLVFSK